MRWSAAIIGGFSALAAGAATAAPIDTPFSREALFGAAFVAPNAVAAAVPSVSFDPDGLGQARYVPGLGVLRTTSGELASFGGVAVLPYVDSIRFSAAVFDPLLGPTLLRPGAFGNPGGQNFDISYVRNWPQAFSVDAGRLVFDVTPHAGVGLLAGGGRTAEAGALFRLQERLMHAFGVTGPDPGRFYLFAGATGRAVDLNLIHAQANVGPDPDQGFVSESQLGVGFERGLVQASLGFTHQSLQLDSFGDEARSENRVGFTISIH